ncbi:hypothetical protein CFC21_080982 [Triticum aestivum]|uniref:Protein kinase domain-containing protein n=3 Tax=Triticinae TaxID=1648030 RepID=A0A3B6N3R0_WHEAT|nr:hypothetical protein CFC21_080982 [Triticum aestivum]
MDRQASTSHIHVLERILLDENAEPTDLPLSLLKGITNGFSPAHQIGRGGFAEVYKGVVGKGMVAVKRLSRTFAVHENKFQEEVKCLIKAKHKNIVRFLGYCADTQGKMEEYEGNLVMADQRNWLLCFEYVCNGSLDKHITAATCGLNWRQRYQIIRGICEGLLFLHKKRILHSDLKPANILLDGHMVPKIADFGLSRCLGEEQTRYITQNLWGTLGYVDPEYIRSRQISFSSDMYSLGVIIMEIVAGIRCYREDEDVIQSWMIRLEALEGDIQLEQVRVCCKIAVECMDLDPKKRPVAQHIVNRLDKTASADYLDETSIGNSLFQPWVSCPREQPGERIGKLAAGSLQVDVEEHSEILEDVAESIEWLHFQDGQQKIDQLPSRGVQDTKQKVNRCGTSISSCIPNVFYKLNKLNIFHRKASRNLHSIDMHTLEKLHNIKIFTKEELKPIINSTNLIGRGVFSHVYKGYVDNTQVAVKIPFTYSSLQNLEFENQVVIMSQVSHKNIVRLIGCCLEAGSLMLVYEFVSNGSLDEILHSRDKVMPLNLDVRLNIVAESAQGLAYLHSQARAKTVHGDVKSANILLDDDFVPKISDVGITKLIDLSDWRYSSILVGGGSYIRDPVYVQTGMLTEKTDVYCFGIVILEVISGKKPNHYDDSSCGLATRFLDVHKEGKKATHLFDMDIAVTAGDLEILGHLAEIAVECINFDADQQRPTMTDVAERLLILNRSRRPQAV